MQLREIISRDNPAVKEYVQLAASAKVRREKGLFVTEGWKLAQEALTAGCAPQAIYADTDALGRFPQLAQWVEQGVPVCRISAPVAQKLAQSPGPQGVFGVFAMLDNQTQTVKIGRDGKYLLLCDLQDPGNLGTILRTAAALGVDGAFLSQSCPDLYSLKVLRASMGGVFKLPIEITPPADAAERLRTAGLPVYAAALRGDAQPVNGVDFSHGCAVMIGNEGNGLPDELVDGCDGVVLIPMRPGSESLNAAMAAGILMWEMTKARIS